MSSGTDFKQSNASCLDTGVNSVGHSDIAKDINTYCWSVDDIVYTGKALVSPLFGFSESDLENGVLVRYLKSDPNCVEFTNMGHGVRVFGWLIYVAVSVIGGFFAFVEFFGL